MKHLKKFALAIAVACLWPAAAYATGQVVTGNVTFTASFNVLKSSGLINPEPFSQAIQQNVSYANGTGSAQVDTFYAAQLTLAAAPTTLNLTSLTDPAGNSINFARVRELIVQNTNSANPGFDVKVEAASSNGVAFLPPTTAPLMCRYGSVVHVSDRYSTGSGNGNVTTPSTATSITLDPGANTVVVNVIMVGGSAQ